MEKLGPPEKLTPKKKAALAEVDARYQAKIAEKEILMRQQVEAARMSGDSEAVATLSRMMAEERGKIEADREKEKAKIRESK